MKINWKNPYVIFTTILLGMGALYGIVKVSFYYGEKNALEEEYKAVNNQLQNPTGRINPDEHLRLLAKKTVLEKLLKNY